MMCNKFTCAEELEDFFLHGIGKWTDFSIASRSKQKMEAFVRNYNKENK